MRLNLVGQRFDALVVLASAGGNHYKKALWECRCDCGRTVIKSTPYLKRELKGPHSCGCIRHHVVKHGKTGTPEHRTWLSMIKRCETPAATGYSDYGGRGIKVSPVWRHDFDAFLRDVGPRPSDRHSLDRIDNDGDYEPGNVRWATVVEQNNNRRPRRWAKRPEGMTR